MRKQIKKRNLKKIELKKSGKKPEIKREETDISKILEKEIERREQENLQKIRKTALQNSAQEWNMSQDSEQEKPRQRSILRSSARQELEDIAETAPAVQRNIENAEEKDKLIGKYVREEPLYKQKPLQYQIHTNIPRADNARGEFQRGLQEYIPSAQNFSTAQQSPQENWTEQSRIIEAERVRSQSQDFLNPARTEKKYKEFRME